MCAPISSAKLGVSMSGSMIFLFLSAVLKFMLDVFKVIMLFLKYFSFSFVRASSSLYLIFILPSTHFFVKEESVMNYFLYQEKNIVMCFMMRIKLELTG